MLRVIVIGTTGSGKTTLARELARRLGVPHGEQDAWNHEADWQMAPLDRFRARVDAFTFGPAWVMDGNYAKARDLGWARADTLVWLDYPLCAVMWRAVTRSLRRVVTREELWNGNRERWNQLLAADAPIRWAWSTHRRRRSETPALAAEYPHLRLVRLRSPAEAQRWLESHTELK